METFFNLIQEVQKKDRCHRCGGCVTFCTAVNYGALELDEDGKPRYADIEKCIECGLCYSICPEIDELEEMTKQRASWSAPMGRVIETTIGRATDTSVREAATDGGVVTALLLHLFETGRIDGAIVTKPTGHFQRHPCLATNAEEIRNGAGFYFDTSHGMKGLSDAYLTYSSIEEFAPMVRQRLRRVALVEGKELDLPGKSVCDTCPTIREGKGQLKKLRRFLQKPNFTPGEPIDKMHCLLAQGILCMGPVTKAGCGGDGVNPRCISARVPCRGCYGPVRHEGNQRLDMLNALASNGIDINSLPESTSMLRFSGGHQLLKPIKEA